MYTYTQEHYAHLQSPFYHRNLKSNMNPAHRTPCQTKLPKSRFMPITLHHHDDTLTHISWCIVFVEFFFKIQGFWGSQHECGVKKEVYAFLSQASPLGTIKLVLHMCIRDESFLQSHSSNVSVWGSQSTFWAQIWNLRFYQTHILLAG